MAKYPTPGAVKTRLAADLGPDAAARIARAFIRDLAARLAARQWQVVWAVSPAGAPFGEVVPGARTVDQVNGDLGRRMVAGIARVQAETPGPVLVLGMDTPQAPLGALERAGRMLRDEADVVVGPADDGGYWLIGVRDPAAAVFDGIPWSTPHVWAATRRAAEMARVRLCTVARAFDIDDRRDLERLRRWVTRTGVRLPATMAELARLDLA